MDLVSAGLDLPRRVVERGGPAFVSSAIGSGSGTIYEIVFTALGVYPQDCAVHGGAMTGRVVVQ